MKDLEQAIKRQQEAEEKLEQSIHNIVNIYARTMPNKTEYLRLEPEIAELIRGEG